MLQYVVYYKLQLNLQANNLQKGKVGKMLKIEAKKERKRRQ